MLFPAVWLLDKYLSWVLAYLLLGCGRHCMLVWRLWRFLQWSTAHLWSWWWTAEGSESSNQQGSKSDGNKRNYSQECNSYENKTIWMIPTWGFFLKMHICSVITTSVCTGTDGRPMSWKGTLSFWACGCDGRTGVSPASLSEVWTLSSFSRKVSTLCSRGAVLLANEGGLFSQGLENSRCSALGEGRWETKAPLWAFKRACRISPSFGETLLIGNKHQKVGNVTKCNLSTSNAVQTANAC